MASVESSLSTIVQVLVPKSRSDQGMYQELVKLCWEIIDSHIGQAREPDIWHLAELIKRQIARSHADPVASLRFSNLLARLLDQPVLSRKHAVLLFLHSLSSSTNPTSATNTLMPSLAPPPPVRTPIPRGTTPSSNPEITSKSKSRAELLQEYRGQIGKPHIPEHLLLRDALYLLQGISGIYVQFTEEERHNEGANSVLFCDDPEYIISPQRKAMIHRMAEMGHLYARVSSFVQAKEGQSTLGTIEQSLCHYLQTQLTEYYRLVATLESQMNAKTPTTSLGDVTAESSVKQQDSGLTLLRLEVWINEWRLRMRMMSAWVDEAKDVHGGALVSLIHGYTDNGDPFIRKFTDQLLEQVSQPFFSMLQKWLFAGELQDPFSEFFVAVNPELARSGYPRSSGNASFIGDGGFGGLNEDAGPEIDPADSGMRLWEGKYRFRKEMLPRFVGETFGWKIFSTGKSLNFIRYSCQDSDWVATRNKLSSDGRTLKYGDIGGLERSIDTAYQIASQRLFEVLFEKFKLLDHLSALKDYLMLCHGDFADQLMETLGPSLSRPANTLYRHNLTATLESAISSSNAQNDPQHVLHRLDARMLEYSHGEIGWDVFTLEYRIDPPIDTVINPESMINYLKLFNHIWKMRRVESSLAKGWMKIASGSRTFLKLPELETYWHQTRLVMGEMIHVIRQMQMYTQIEVIAVRWNNLLAFVQKKEGDLDSLIAAHRNYLAELVDKTLMISRKSGKEETVLDRVRELFRVILQFLEAVDEFYNYSLAEAARRDQLRDYERGVYTGTQPQNPLVHAVTLDRILERIKEYGSSFSEEQQTVVQALLGHTDSDCKDLAARLNFNRYYSQSKEREQRQKLST